jgi:hypothetical protein
LFTVHDCKRLAEHCTAAEVFGSRKTVLIQLCPSEHTMPFRLCSRQLNTEVTFAVMISKAPGQMLKHVGIYLPWLVVSTASSMWHFPDPVHLMLLLQLLKGIDYI